MSDDLVKRLRLNRSTLQMWLGEHLLEQYEKERTEAADRIKKLEADLEIATMKRLLDSDRIEKLEAALIDILKVPRSEASWGIALVIAHKALEGKDETIG